MWLPWKPWFFHPSPPPTSGPDPSHIMVQSAVISGYNEAINVTCSVQATANTDEAGLTMVWIDPQVGNTSRIS